MARRSKAEREFVSEAEEILELMRGDLADLREVPGTGREADPEQLNRLFRSAHSLKALASMFRFQPVEDLTHRLEDLLDVVRLGRVALNSAAVECIDESVQLFASILAQVGDLESLESFAPAIAERTRRIEVLSSGQSDEAGDFEALAIDSSILHALTEYEEHRLRENIRRGRAIALVTIPFDMATFEDGLSEATSALRDRGEVLSTLPAPGESGGSQIKFLLLVATDLDFEALEAVVDFPGAVIASVLEGRGVLEDSVADSPAPVAPVESGDAQSLRSISETVRVDIRKLDELMNLVGELVIQRGAFGDAVAEVAQDPATARLGKSLAKIHQGFDRKLRDLQAAVLDVRMVPLRQVFEKISRVVRRLQRDLGKVVHFEVRGADTELDKLIVEALVDPLLHVVRNALDHAIESPEERAALGKDPTARIGIEAFQRGNHVVVAVADDGRGIDLEKVRSRAEALGHVGRDEVLTDKECLDLLFLPGLSTASSVTETSGRGVGMDVVRTNLTALGGVVDVDTALGHGTTFSMTLPITLAIVQSLIVAVGSSRFAIPLNAVLETLLVDATDVQRSEGRELYNLRGQPLMLRRLDREFALSSSGALEKFYLVVVGIGDQRIGLVVDRLEGQQDTVIKSIQGPIEGIHGISGATDLGDQSPVLVLDVAAFVEDATRRREGPA